MSVIDFRTRDSYIAFGPKTVAGSLMLVELWKGLVVLPCLASLVEEYEVHTTPWQMGKHSLWVKMLNLYRM
jgi:hypothetical protein